MVNLQSQVYQKKKHIEKVGAKTAPDVKKKSDVEVGPKTTPVFDEIPVNLGKNAEVGEDVNVDDIEKYYIETGEYGQHNKVNQALTLGLMERLGYQWYLNMGRHHKRTRATRYFQSVHAGMLEVFLNQFDERVKRINNHFMEGFQLYPESEKIKEKHMMWTEMLKKVASTCTTSGQPHTPTDKTPEKETN
ncbi:hypothetical protein Hanom_Chr02g00138031 [Helianthus anomalus]